MYATREHGDLGVHAGATHYAAWGSTAERVCRIRMGDKGAERGFGLVLEGDFVPTKFAIF
jgi:hypothetical protein